MLILTLSTATCSQLSYGLVPAMLALLGLVMIYGYTAVPNSAGAIGRLLGSRGDDFRSATPDVAARVKEGDDSELNTLQAILDNVVHFRLGHPGVGQTLNRIISICDLKLNHLLLILLIYNYRRFPLK